MLDATIRMKVDCGGLPHRNRSTGERYPMNATCFCFHVCAAGASIVFNLSGMLTCTQ